MNRMFNLTIAGVLFAGCADGPSASDVQQQVLDEVEWRSLDPDFCEEIFTFEHQIDVGDGVVVRVVEKFSPASVLRFPRRALLMLPGTLVTGDMYDIDVDDPVDFSALNRAARAGFYAYAVTYEGYPGSSAPDDGSTVTAPRMLAQMGEVVQWIRKNRLVLRVDLLGASIGSSLATALGGEHSPLPKVAIGRLILMALVYKQVTPLFEQVFFSPEVQELLENAPNGYIGTAPEMYGLLLADSDPTAAAWCFENFPDVYATGPTLEGFDLPLFEAQHGRAPALQMWGDLDLITPLQDVEQFQSEYGGSSELRILPGAGHAPYMAAPDLTEAFWSETFEFLDYGPVNVYLACAP
jgi:pimeloyl-ACP methyl ester carboxylesterase